MSSLRARIHRFLTAGLTWLSRRWLPQTRGSLRIRGLASAVEIIRDDWGVPHIYARNTHDLMFAQGFVHAQDRIWQMDFSRRLAAGRLAEVLGETAIAADRLMRVLGLKYAAERDVALLYEAVSADMAAYAAGVNACIAAEHLPLEFFLLGYRPELWTVLDTLLWSKFMSWVLSANWETEILRAQLIAQLGPDLARQLEPYWPEQCPMVFSAPGGGAQLGRSAQERVREARPFTGPTARDGLGSNSWVIAGARTASGSPLLANDMHLSLGVPSVLYENHLVGGDLNLTGVSMPGIPLVIAGHNGHVAWGLSNAFCDVQDLYVERLRRAGDGRWQYLYRSAWLEAKVRQERICVRGHRAVVEEAILTPHGPIINPVIAESGDQPLALRWTALDPETTLNALHAMAWAQNSGQFREALRQWSSPVQNVTYADADGHIGYALAGTIPVRARGDGRTPVPGWTGEYEWTGHIPFEEMPHLFDPRQGYLVTANNRILDDQYPYELGTDYAVGDRAQRITELIGARTQMDMGYMRRMQLDWVAPRGRVLARYLGQLPVQEPELARIGELMRGWDGRVGPESVPAAIYEVFVQTMIYLVLEGRLGDRLARRYRGLGPLPGMVDITLFGCRAREWLEHVLSNAQPAWFGDKAAEGRDDAARRALRATIDWLKETLGPMPEDWAWGKLHRLTFHHALGQEGVWGQMFNRGPYAVGGDYGTICATGPRDDLRDDHLVGPPSRIIVDLGDWANSVAVMAPGQSERVGSSHYDDQVTSWLNGEYHPLLYTRADVEERAEARLCLIPER